MQNVSQLVLTSSRKKYVQRDEGLLGLALEKSALSYDELPVVNFRSLTNKITPENNIAVIKQMNAIEKKIFEVKWPDSMALENMIGVLFERLKIVRDINKRHIQRRAFIDLLKFMKEQGLQHNFQSNIHPMILDNTIVSLKGIAKSGFSTGLQGEEFKKYYLKSHELLLMLENASEAQNAGSEHLRNIEIIRVRGFSQSLI